MNENETIMYQKTFGQETQHTESVIVRMTDSYDDAWFRVTIQRSGSAERVRLTTNDYIEAVSLYIELCADYEMMFNAR